MSPVDLPGDPIEPPESKNTIKCPNCNRVHIGASVAQVLKVRTVKDIRVKCKNCGYTILLKKLPK